MNVARGVWRNDGKGPGTQSSVPAPPFAAHWTCSLLELGFVHANNETRQSSAISYIQAETPNVKTIKDPSMEAW